MLAAASAVAAFAVLSAGAANAAQTLSWSFSGSTVAFCNFGQCGVQPAQIAGHVDKSGSDFNAGTVVIGDPRGRAGSAAEPGAGGLLPDLHALAFTTNQTPGQANLAWTFVEGVQVFKWTGGSFDLDPSIFEGSIDYSASNVAPGASGMVAGFAILDSSVLDDNSAGNPWFNFQTNAGGGITGAFQGNCDTPGAVGIANSGQVNGKGNVVVNIGAAACNGSLHLETGDEFVLWSKMYVYQFAPGIMDASHTFHVTLADDVPPETVQTLARNVVLESYSYAVPEPATWALMILGFGGVGAALRGRRRTAAAIA